jgi:hypothetical protein
VDGPPAGEQQTTRLETSFVLFDALYQDGTKTSYRKIPASEIHELEDIKAARALIEAQDRNIAERSGVQTGPVKTVLRSTKQ